MNNKRDLKNKHILITGADGFIGSHIVEILSKQNYNVRAFVYYNAFNNWGWLDTFTEEQLDKIDIFLGDVRDSNCVKESMKDVDIVMHLAALISIPYSYISPESYAETNIIGTLNVLQAAKDMNCERILITSTSEVYGTAEYVPIDERHPLKAQSPYSATKIGAEKLAEAFYRSFDLPVTIVRPFNTYGPRQSARAVIPTIITQLLCGNDKIKLGDLNPTRDFVYVKDTAQGFIKIAESYNTIGEVINIAREIEVSMGDLANAIISQINPDAETITDKEKIRPKASEVERLQGSSENLRKLTGWMPTYTLEQGLKETIEWFLNSDNLSKYKSNIYNY